MSVSEERDIKTISFGRACRERLGMYLSFDLPEAIHLGSREIYVNSLDALTETDQKSGEILVEIMTPTKTVKVVDNGPGIPNKMRDDGLQALVAAYTLAHTGSHFDGRKVSSIGTNGVGGSIVNHTAKYFIVTSDDGKTRCTAKFKSDGDGAKMQEFAEGKSKGKTGVEVLYMPDPAVYQDAWFNEESMKNELSEMMKFYPRYTLTLNFDGRISKFHYPNGLKDASTKIYYESDTLILALDVTGKGISPYGNRLYLPNGGAFFTHFKSQLTRMVNDLSGLKLTGQQVQSVFGGYIAVFVTEPLFSNQSKTAISNKECNLEITNALREGLQKFSKSQDWARVMKELETEMKAEAAAEKARQRVKNAVDKIKSGGAKKRGALAEKFKDCIETGDKAWLAITEGDSAQGALNSGRDIHTVATLPIRGKFINCLKAKQEDYLDNEELQQIFQLLGCGIFNEYNAKKLKYGRVLIAVDADPDGKNIACLLTTCFYVVAPQFIKEGRLWWMRAPLYYDEDHHKYIFTEEQWKKERNKKNFTRAKGLGEMTPEAVKESLFGEQKDWVQLKPQSWTQFSRLIEDLMGKDVDTRRQYLFDKVDFEKVTFL